MIAAALPPSAPPAAADSVSPARGAKVPADGFAQLVEAAAGEAPAEAETPPADPRKEEAPAAPTAAAPPIDPAQAAGAAAALIAQLSPPPAAPAAPPSPPESAPSPPRAQAAPRIRQASGERPAKAAAKETAFDLATAAAPQAEAAPAQDAAVQASALPAGTAVTTTAADAPSTLAAAAPADTAIVRHLDLAHQEGWLDSLARDIARSAEADSRLRFTLAPEHLGKLTVDLAAREDGTAIRLTTESREAHRIVSEAQPLLVAEARAQGLRISEAQVDLGGRSGGDAQAQAFSQQPQSGAGGQAGQDRPRPAVIWSEASRRRAASADGGAPVARDLFA